MTSQQLILLGYFLIPFLNILIAVLIYRFIQKTTANSTFSTLGACLVFLYLICFFSAELGKYEAHLDSSNYPNNVNSLYGNRRIVNRRQNNSAVPTPAPVVAHTEAATQTL